MMSPLRRFPSPQPRFLELINGDQIQMQRTGVDLSADHRPRTSRIGTPKKRSKASERSPSRTSLHHLYPLPV